MRTHLCSKAIRTAGSVPPLDCTFPVLDMLTVCWVMCNKNFQDKYEKGKLTIKRQNSRVRKNINTRVNHVSTQKLYTYHECMQGGTVQKLLTWPFHYHGKTLLWIWQNIWRHLEESRIKGKKTGHGQVREAGEQERIEDIKIAKDREQTAKDERACVCLGSEQIM